MKKNRKLKSLFLLFITLLCLLGFLPKVTDEVSRAEEANFYEILGTFANSFTDSEISPDSASKDPSAAPVPAENRLPNGSLPADSWLEVDFLDVGQGLSVLVNIDGHYLLYDGGGRSSSSFVVSYLKKKGVKKLDYLIASHYDSDHLSGLIGALNVFETDVILGPDYEADSKIYRSFKETINGLEQDVLHPEPGSLYPVGNGYFEVLAPLSNKYDEENDRSVVIRLVHGSTSFLLTGDAMNESEKDMEKVWPDLKSDVLCVGHHGSPSSTGDSFLEKVNPSAAVISCGEDNPYGHPAQAVLDRLSARDIVIYRTDESGTVTVSGDGTNLTWSTEY